MTLYELTPPLVSEDLGTGSLHPGNPFRKTRARLASHFDELISDIDAALKSTGWSSDRTGFATTEFVQALPRPTIAAAEEQPLALRTFERIRDMLSLDDQQTAALVGISRNTPRDWRNGNQPRAATTRRLYELSGVLDLVATRQTDMSAWIQGVSPDGQTWLELASGDDGPASILRHVRSSVLTGRPSTPLEVEEDDETHLDGPVAGKASTLVKRGGRRRRAR